MHAQHARRWLTAVLTRARAGAPTDATTRNECGPRAGGARTGGWSKAPSSALLPLPLSSLSSAYGGGCRVAARPDGPGQSRPRTYGRGARLRGPGAKADCPPAACHRTSPCPCHLETRARAMATPHAGPEQARSEDSET